MEEQLIAKSLYVVNKKAKEYRDLLNDLYNFRMNGQLSDNLEGYLCKNYNMLFVDGQLCVADEFDGLYFSKEEIQNEISNLRYKLDTETYEDCEDEEIVEDDIEEMYRILKQFSEQREIIWENIHLKNSLIKKAKDLYLLKYKVIDKLGLVPQEYHKFDDRIYALYSYCGYSFHRPTTKTDVSVTKELEMISSSCKITDMSIDEAIDNLKSFLLTE